MTDDELQPTPGVVLIVDDDKPIADFVATVVAEYGYTPVVATRGAQALELARTQWPALLITDLMLPFMSGGALIATLRAAAAANGRAAPPAALMTAASLRHAGAAGAEAILRKPFDLADLEALLRRFLGPPPRRADGGETQPRPQEAYPHVHRNDGSTDG